MLSRVLFQQSKMKMAPKTLSLAPISSLPMRLFSSNVIQKDRSDICIIGNPLIDISVELEDDSLLRKYGLQIGQKTLASP